LLKLTIKNLVITSLN